MKPDKPKKEVESEIHKAIEASETEQRLSTLLSALSLRPVKRLLMMQYGRQEQTKYPPMAMAKAVIYRKARDMSRPEMVELLDDRADVAEAIGFDLANLPTMNTFKVFEQQNLTSQIEIILDHAAEYLREECNNHILFSLETEDPVGRMEAQQDPNVDTDLGQDWPAYNAAQTKEKVIFKRLAAELAANIEDTRGPAKGRNGYDVQTKVFLLLLKEYTGKSGRRFISEVMEANEQEYIDKTPHFNTVLNFYGDEALTGLLHKLITVTAKPLENIEQDFAVDATGLGTGLYKCWHDTKFNDSDERREYRKLHVMSGVKTNIITSVRVTDGLSGDAPEFTKLLEETAFHFDIREVSADKAYSSRENLQAVSDAGGVPFIPFKENVTGKARGTMIWNRMHEYFQQHRDEFMRHYHKRSNAETVFAMMKTKIDTKLNNKQELNQFNEALVKCLVHNLIVLIHEMHELDVDVDFNYCADQVLAQE